MLVINFEEINCYLRKNQVNDLQSRNRKLYCEMNDKIDTVRNFWRNSLVEGDTRSAICVKLRSCTKKAVKLIVCFKLNS